MRRELSAQAAIGRYGKTGLARVAFTPEYNRVRDLVRGWMEAAGLEARVDAVGNLFGRKEGRVPGLPVVMTGSHLDTQRPGGRFDGIAGVLAGLEAVRRIAETGAGHDHPLEVVAFHGEESSCGLACFGSGVLSGRLGVAEMRAAVHPPTGRSVFEALRAVGGDPAGAARCVLPRGYLKAFVELHIEQGPVLEARKVPIGIIDGIVGRRWGEIRFAGVTAHAGGQPMSYRRDAAQAAAEFMVEAEAAARRAPERERLTLTFGEVSAEPGWVSIIPGGARLSFDLRAKTAAAMDGMLARMRRALARIDRARRVRGQLRVQGRSAPCPASAGIRRALREAARLAGYPAMTLSSGGLHDACLMASLAPMGMMFVPSVKGLSHTPAERTHLADLAAGAEVLARALVRLADRRVQV
jgi:allantoate deiminase